MEMTELTCTKQVFDEDDVMCGQSMGEMLLVSRDGVHWRAFPRCGSKHTVAEDVEMVGKVLGGGGPRYMAAIQFGEVEYHEGPYSREELAEKAAADRRARQAEDAHPDARLI